MSSETNAPIPELAYGWTPERKALFLDLLSQKGNVRAAAARVGLSREAAYKLRRRDPLFARGWAAALALAREACVEVLADRAIDGVEERVFYRGELIDTRRRYDSRLLLAHIARLDRVADADEAAQADAARFDELLACVAGKAVPPDLAGDDGLPLSREDAAERTSKHAEWAVHDAEPEDEGDSENGYDEAAFDAFEAKCATARKSGRAEGEARHDLWFEDACSLVDALPDLVDPPSAPVAPEDASSPTDSVECVNRDPAAPVEPVLCS